MLHSLQAVCRQPTDLRPWDVGDVNLAGERDHVVLAQAVDLNALDEYHFVVVLLEHRPVHDARQALAVPPRARQQGFRHSLGRLHQALPRHVFPQALQQRRAGCLHLRQALLIVVRYRLPRLFGVNVGRATSSLDSGPCGSAVARFFASWASRCGRSVGGHHNWHYLDVRSTHSNALATADMTYEEPRREGFAGACGAGFVRGCSELSFGL